MGCHGHVLMPVLFVARKTVHNATTFTARHDLVVNHFSSQPAGARMNKSRLLLAAMILVPLLATADEPTIDPKDLPRVKATEVPDAIKAFQLKKGLRIEPAANEPQVESPICITFDENGR